MGFVVAAACIGAVAVYVSVMRLRQFDASAGRELEGLGIGRSGRVDASRLPPDSLVRELIREALDAPTVDHAAAALSELKLEASRELRAVGAIPKVAVRVCLASGTLFAILSLSGALGAGALSLTQPSLAFGVGLISALACGQIGRVLKERSDKRRASWRRLLGALASRIDPSDETPGNNTIIDAQPASSDG